MNKRLIIPLVLILFLNIRFITAQVITYTPLYPKVTDSITIYFDATMGNGALTGTNDVYIHTGVVTNRSVSLSDWKYRPAIWGTADTTVLMQSLGNNIHTITFRIDSFYSIPNNVEALDLGFVFRNADGSIVGKNADGSDIFIPLYKQGFDARFTSPLGIPLVTTQGSNIPIEVKSTDSAMINLFFNNALVSQNYGINLNSQITAAQYGKYWLKFTAQKGSETITDSTYYIVQPPSTVQNPPSGIENGINYINDSTVTLCLLAPQKNFVYFRGDLTNWELEPSFMMKKSVNGEQYWIEITGLVPQQEYRFQYCVDAKINTADPYSEKILDEFNDPGINAVIYPNLIPYPVGKTSDIVSVFQTAQAPYNWVTTNYQMPAKEDMIIYELLVRDFSSRHDFKAVIDKLDYLKDLGINTIELMPVMEFDGNDSWGYAPSFFMAVDKYYGPANQLKALVDSAHSKGIAIILDIAINHAFGQFPYVKLYWDDEAKKPSGSSPWFNADPRHPFSVGYDFNHESNYTQTYFDKILKYWAENFKIDGYRIDLSKGITQNNTFGDVGAWSQYDGSRINLLKRYANALWSTHSNKYIILEHFANNDEETELANFGFMLWSIAHDPFKEAVLGWPQANSDFSWNISYQAKNWNNPYAVGFFESHDEERLMYEMLNYGNYAGTYNIRQLKTALKRKALAAAFLYTVPGPKMMWQFGELGYDYSIFWPSGTEVSRTAKKPVRWDYYDDVDRRCLFCNYSAIIKLRNEHQDIFRSPNYNIDASGLGKRIWVSHNNMNVLILGNFSVNTISMVPDFQHTGTWYNYLAGTSYVVNNTQDPISLAPGEFLIFTNTQLPNPQIENCCNIGGVDNIDNDNSIDIKTYPNPFDGETNFTFYLNKASELSIDIYDILGKKVNGLFQGKIAAGEHIIKWDGADNEGHRVTPGAYYCIFKSAEINKTAKVVIF